MSKQDRTDACYQHGDKMCTLTQNTSSGLVTHKGTTMAFPMRKPMTRTADGVTISRREYKQQRALAKSLKRKINGSR